MLAGGTLGGVLRHPDPPLSDGVVTLRAKTRADVEAIAAAAADPEIPRWTLVPNPYSLADALDWIAATELGLDSGVGIDWLVVDAEDRLLASIGLMGIDRERAIGEIGYWVAREARGRGVATRALRLVSAWATSELGLTTLELLIHADNAPSHAVARAAGFTHDGERRTAPREGLPEGDYLLYRRHPET